MATKVAQPVDVGLAAFTGLTPATMPVSVPVAAAITAAIGAIDPGTGSGVTPTAASNVIPLDKVYQMDDQAPTTAKVFTPLNQAAQGSCAFAVTAVASVVHDFSALGLLYGDPVSTTAGDVNSFVAYCGLNGRLELSNRVFPVGGVVPAQLSISGSPVSYATEGTPYNGFTVSTAGGTAPRSLSLIGAPTGMTVNSSSGAVSYPVPAEGSYTGIKVRVTDAANATADLTFNLTVAAAGSTPAYKVGFYTNDPVSQGQNQTNTFLANYDEWVREMGVQPQSMNVFVDFTQTTANWAGDIYYKMQYLNATGSSYVASGGTFIPEIGLAMCSNDMGHDEWLDAMNAGTYDQYILDIAKNAGTAGYPVVHFRPGYEFNGGFMKWSPANSGRPGRNADFINAFKRIYTLIHQSATANGFTARVIWNPTAINYNSGNLIIEDLYPGDAFCDVVGLDIYGKMYPRDLTDWRDGTTQMANFAAWSAVTENINHYLSWNDATQSSPHGDGGGCSAERLAAFALAHSKPFSFPECGCGNNDVNVGPIDNFQFPIWLKDFCNRWTAQGLNIINMNIWSTDQGDGGWGYLFGQRPLAAVQWGQKFGAAVVDDGLPKALKFYGNTDGSNYAYLPDSPSLRATTQVVRITARKSKVTAASDALLGGKWNNQSASQFADYKEYFFSRNADGKLLAVWRTASTVAVATSSVVDGVALGTTVERRCQFNPVTGLTQFYLSTDGGSTFTQLGTDVTATNPGAIAATANRQDILIGQHSGGGREMTGTQGGLEIVIGGTTVLDANTTTNGMLDSVSGNYFGRGSVPIVNASTGLPYRPTSGGTSPSAPGAPTITAGTPTSTTIPANATAPTTGGTPNLYSWERKLTSAADSTYVVAGTTPDLSASPDFTFSGLTASTGYSIRARASADGGTTFGAYSNVATASTAAASVGTTTFNFTAPDSASSAGNGLVPFNGSVAGISGNRLYFPASNTSGYSGGAVKDCGAANGTFTGSVTVGQFADGQGPVVRYQDPSNYCFMMIHQDRLDIWSVTDGAQDLIKASTIAVNPQQVVPYAVDLTSGSVSITAQGFPKLTATLQDFADKNRSSFPSATKHGFSDAKNTDGSHGNATFVPA